MLRTVKAEMSILTFVLFAVAGTAVPILWAQDQAIRHCQELGPARCQIAAIRGH